MSNAVPPLQDPILIERSIAGDRSARERLAGACLPRVRRTIFMLVGRSEDAEDLVQISLARIFGGLASFRSESRLTTWMDRIMKKRTALVLSAAYGYTVSEIAEMTGCTTETAKKRLQHGRRELLARLRKDPCLNAAFEEIES